MLVDKAGFRSGNIITPKISPAFSGHSAKESKVATAPCVKPSAENLQAYTLSYGVKQKLGSFYNPESDSVDFGLFSKNATRIELCLFDKPIGEDPVATVQLKKKNGTNNWFSSVKIDDLVDYGLIDSADDLKQSDEKPAKPLYYGYRIWGDNWKYSPNWKPGSDEGKKSLVGYGGERFNPNKLAYDPRGNEISHMPGDADMFWTSFFSGQETGTIDSSKTAPKSVFVVPQEVEIVKGPTRALKDDIIAEVHLKDLTMGLNIPEIKGIEGTYKAAGMMAPVIKDMGITMVEFLPLHEFDPNQDGGNHWGYMTMDFFAPVKRYSSDKTPGGAVKEFKQMINAYHKQDIKVCMDVVYNHTGEGGHIQKKNGGGKDLENTAVTSMKLIDNSSYYKLYNGYYGENSGCGNDYNIANKDAQMLVIDSIEYWAKMGVDAFRFDLAAQLLDIQEHSGNNYASQSPESFVNKVKVELEKRGIKVKGADEKGPGISLIAEPWTAAGSDTQQQGNFPHDSWTEWNDGAKKVFRQFTCKQEDLSPSRLRNTLEGSPDRYGRGLHSSTNSVNFVTAHDGFTLKDLVSYNRPDNRASNGGDQSEICWNHNGNPEKQMRAMKNLTALLLLSKGIPMVQLGDLIAHSKNGNNNTYCLDNEYNWLNFDKMIKLGKGETPSFKLDYNEVKKSKEKGRILKFTKSMIEFRKQHNSLRDLSFYSGKDNNKNGLKDVTYVGTCGSEIPNDNIGHWHNPNANFTAYRIDATEFNEKEASSIFVATNKSAEKFDCKFPKNLNGKQWYLVADTNTDEVNLDGKLCTGKYSINPQSVMIFVEK